MLKQIYAAFFISDFNKKNVFVWNRHFTEKMWNCHSPNCFCGYESINIFKHKCCLLFANIYRKQEKKSIFCTWNSSSLLKFFKRINNLDKEVRERKCRNSLASSSLITTHFLWYWRRLDNMFVTNIQATSTDAWDDHIDYSMHVIEKCKH